MIEYNTDDQSEIGSGGDFSVKVIGVGGAGANVLDRMALEGSEEAELLTLNTDLRALSTSVSSNKIQLGATLLKGMGAGGDPELGKQAALEAVDEIRNAVRGYKMVFVSAGLGGGTGSGAAPEVCRIAKEEGVFLVVFCTLPFTFEGKRRMDQALEALDTISGYANAVITFDNDRMGELIVPKDGVTEAFAAADKIISQSVRATMNVVADPGIIRIGMDDLLSALDAEDSRCLFGYGVAKGDSRAHEAIEQALKCPLLDKGKLLENARNVMVQVSGGDSMTLFEVELVMQEVSKHIGDKTQILFGTGTDKRLGSALSVTVISSLNGPRRGHGGDDDGGSPPPARISSVPSSVATAAAAAQTAPQSPLAEAVSAAEAVEKKPELAPAAPPVSRSAGAPEETSEPEAEVASEVESEPEPVAAAPEPDPVDPDPEPVAPEPPVVAAEPEPEPEPVAAATEPEPVPVAPAPPVVDSPVAPPEIEPEPEPAPPVLEDESPVEPEEEHFEEEDVVAEEEAPSVLNPQIQSQSRTVVDPEIQRRPVVQAPMQLVTNPIAQAFGAGEPEQEEELEQVVSPPAKKQVVPPPRRAPRPLTPFASDDESLIEVDSPETDSVVANLDNSQKIRLTRIVPGETGTQRVSAKADDTGGQPVQPEKKRIVRKKVAAKSAAPTPPAEQEATPPVVESAGSQEMLPLDPGSKGRFEKTDPTIVDGEDLDVPTFLRKRKK